jgi:hypothetical protein
MLASNAVGSAIVAFYHQETAALMTSQTLNTQSRYTPITPANIDILSSEAMPRLRRPTKCCEAAGVYPLKFRDQKHQILIVSAPDADPRAAEAVRRLIAHPGCRVERGESALTEFIRYAGTNPKETGTTIGVEVFPVEKSTSDQIRDVLLSEVSWSWNGEPVARASIIVIYEKSRHAFALVVDALLELAKEEAVSWTAVSQFLRYGRSDLRQ